MKREKRRWMWEKEGEEKEKDEKIKSLMLLTWEI